MKDQADVEVLVRCYNEEEWIIRCLSAIEKQSIFPRKVHVINNESTDSSGDRVDLFKQDSKLLINHSLYQNKENIYYPGRCLNKYVNEVTSKYTVFLSAHCIPANSQWLISLLKGIENHDKIIASYGRQIPTSKSDARDARDLLWNFGKEERVNQMDIFFHNANSIIRTNILKEHPFDNSITNIEDRVWAHKILSIDDFSIKYNPKAIVFHEHGIHQSGEIKRANQIISIANNTTDLVEYELPKGNLGCLIPYKASGDKKLDSEKIKKAISIAKELNLSNNNIVCSIEGDEELVKDLNSTSIINREFLLDELDNKRIKGLRNILLSINKTCENSNIYFDDILVMEPDYINRKVITIKRLIEKYYSSSSPIAMISIPIKPHIWKVTRSKSVRLDSYELDRDSQERITLAMRGLGMIFKISQLRKENWIDSDIDFIESKDPIECLPSF